MTDLRTPHASATLVAKISATHLDKDPIDAAATVASRTRR